MSDEYSHGVARKLCLQISSLAGYGAASDAALDVLADIVKHFLRQSSITARNYAESSGRTDINAYDIMMSLEEMQFSVEHLNQFASDTGEIPFVPTVPKFPIRPQSESYASFKMKKEKPPAHIPSYLPTFPAEHTYRQTPMFLKKTQDEKTRAVRVHEMKRTTEDVLINLGQEEEKSGNPYMLSIFEESAETEKNPIQEKREKKMAANWTEFLLGRLRQSDEAVEGSTRLLPMTSLSSIPSFESQDVPPFRKKRKEKEPGALSKKEKKPKPAAANQFTAMFKFNLQPPAAPDPTSGESVQDNPSVVSEEQSTSQGIDPLPIIHEETCLASDDVDIFCGNTFRPATDDVDSTVAPGDDSSAPGGTPMQAQAPEEVVETRETSPKSDV